MNIFKDIKALLAMRSVLKTGVQEATKMNGTKPGWKTSEFWMKVITVDIPVIWGVVHNFIPAEMGIKIVTVATALYTIGRVVVKVVADLKSPAPSMSATVSTSTVTTA